MEKLRKNKPLMVGLIFGGLLLLCCCCCTVFMLTPAEESSSEDTQSSEETDNKSEAMLLVEEANELLITGDVDGAKQKLEESKELYSEEDNPSFGMLEEIDNLNSEDYMKDILINMTDEDYSLLLEDALDKSFMNNEVINSLFQEKLKESKERRTQWIAEEQERIRKEEEEAAKRAEEALKKEKDIYLSIYNKLMDDFANDEANIENFEDITNPYQIKQMADSYIRCEIEVDDSQMEGLESETKDEIKDLNSTLSDYCFDLEMYIRNAYWYVTGERTYGEFVERTSMYGEGFNGYKLDALAKMMDIGIGLGMSEDEFLN